MVLRESGGRRKCNHAAGHVIGLSAYWGEFGSQTEIRSSFKFIHITWVSGWADVNYFKGKPSAIPGRWAAYNEETHYGIPGSFIIFNRFGWIKAKIEVIVTGFRHLYMHIQQVIVSKHWLIKSKSKVRKSLRHSAVIFLLSTAVYQ